MAKITVLEAVHVSATIEGEAVDIDLTAGENTVEPSVADLLVNLGLATEGIQKSSAGKKSSSADVAAEITESTEGGAL